MKKIAQYFYTTLLLLGLGCSGNDDSATDTPVVPQDPVQLFPGNFLTTGASANDLLSNTNFERLLIEIAFVEGFRPTQTTVANFTDFIREFSFKDDIELRFTELESANDADNEFTLEEISDLEIENRTAYNDGNTLAIYIYFADESSEGDDLDEGLVTLGAVYRNTSMVIFESTLRNLASRSVVTLTDLETATLNHEFGHLFGLVNLGTVAINDHEDPEAANHCIINPCLMRAQLEFQPPAVRELLFQERKVVSACNLNGLDLVQQMEGNVADGRPAPPVLDAECRLDLSSNGGRPVLDN